MLLLILIVVDFFFGINLSNLFIISILFIIQNSVKLLLTYQIHYFFVYNVFSLSHRYYHEEEVTLLKMIYFSNFIKRYLYTSINFVFTQKINLFYNIKYSIKLKKKKKKKLRSGKGLNLRPYG